MSVDKRRFHLQRWKCSGCAGALHCRNQEAAFAASLWDAFRRVVDRTVAQQVSKAVEEATAPFQHVLKTESVSHVLQTLTDLDVRTTILSVDGVGAFDLISSNSMMDCSTWKKPTNCSPM